LRQRAHAAGCTINDHLLAAVREAGMMVVPLPVGTASADERLAAIVGETSRRKRRPDEGVAGMVAMPRPLAWLGVQWARRAASAHINLDVTNVPGPRDALHLGPARLLSVVPLVAGVRLSVTALSYHDTLAVALLADEAMGDLQPLVDGAAEGLLGAG
jgi:hypothetical protein